jgi:hypothetical protein
MLEYPDTIASFARLRRSATDNAARVFFFSRVALALALPAARPALSLRRRGVVLQGWG